MNQARLRRAALTVAVVLIAAPSMAVAQFVPPPPPQTAPARPQTAPAQPQTAPAQPQTAPTPPSPQAAADQRIQSLRAELHIADAQLPQWNAFAQVMRDNATKTDALFRQRAGAAAGMNALDNMKSYAEIARAYADNTQALATAFEGLYNVLTVQQKQTVDTLFRQDAARTAAQQTKG
jgi:protein CpxP